VQQSTGCASACPLPSWGLTRTMAVSSSTNTYTTTVDVKPLPSLAPAPTRRVLSETKDSCHVEQKNWSVVRRLVGYDRYSSHAALEALNRLYNLLHLYVNFFQPVMKLKAKTRDGAKVHKVYDTARTPYQRLLGAGILTEAKRQELAAIYDGLSPVSLLKQIKENLEHLWSLAEHPAQQHKGRSHNDSVTAIYEATVPVR